MTISVITRHGRNRDMQIHYEMPKKKKKYEQNRQFEYRGQWVEEGKDGFKEEARSTLNLER